MKRSGNPIPGFGRPTGGNDTVTVPASWYDKACADRDRLAVQVATLREALQALILAYPAGGHAAYDAARAELDKTARQ